MRRSLAWPLAVLLALATGAVAGQTTAVLTEPVPAGDSIRADGADTARVVRAYYVAANAVLRTRNPAPLEAVLAPGFRDHGGPAGVPGGGGDLGSALATLGTIAPGGWLEVEELTAVGDRAVARVALRGTGPTAFLGLPLRGVPAAWATLDLFRVADGRVAERWGDAEGAAAFTSFGAAAIGGRYPGYAAVALARATLRPGERLIGPTEMSRVVLVQSGTLTLAAAPAPIGVSRSTAPGGTGVAGKGTTLEVGDLAALPSGTDYGLENRGRGSATVLLVTVGLPAGPQVGYPGELPRSPSRATPSTPPGAAPELLLAGGLAVGLARGEPVVAVGRIVLAPGAAVGEVGAAAPLLLAIMGGQVELGLASGPAWLRNGTDGATRVAHAGTREALGSGDGALVPAGGTMALRNAGDAPAVVIVAVVGSA